MGCDIHFYVERRVDGVWTTADTWEKDYDEELSVPYEKAFYSGRNYSLFAILAGVRNNYDIRPIAEPRGVPKDACPEYLDAVAYWEGDAHSASYLTVAEILSYDWTQTSQHRGFVTPAGWARCRDFPEEGPEGWSGGVGGGNVRHYTPEEFEAAWQVLREEKGLRENTYASHYLTSRHVFGQDADDADTKRFNQIIGKGADVSPYCEVEWTVPYYRNGAAFLSETLPRLFRLGAPDDVRCCFFFDN